MGGAQIASASTPWTWWLMSNVEPAHCTDKRIPNPKTPCSRYFAEFEYWPHAEY
jgi:hypothetical protein